MTIVPAGSLARHRVPVPLLRLHPGQRRLQTAVQPLPLELEFYALHDFARGLCGPVLDLTKHLDAAGVLADRADEARLRDVFASGDAGAIGRLDRYEGLVDFYSTYPGGVAFAAPPAVDAGDIAYLQYTSGSTRIPTGVQITHLNLATNVVQVIEALDVFVAVDIVEPFLAIFFQTFELL